MATPEARRAVLKPPRMSAASPSGSPSALPLITVHDLLWLLYLYPVRWLAILLPRPVIYAIGKAASPLVQFHTRRGKAKAAAWIAKACSVSPAQANRIARQSVSNKVSRFMDELLLLRPSANSLLRCSDLDGMEHLETALARGNGVILLVGHFCANRIAVRYLAMHGHSALFVRNRRPSNRSEGRLGRRFLQPRSLQLQMRAYPDQVYIQDPDCGLRIMRTLRGGGLVLVQMDGHGGTLAVEHSLLGVPWRAPSGIFEIVRLLDCAVVPMLCLGRSDGFRIRFDPMLQVERASSREASVSRNLDRFLSVVEKQVIENPEEWTLWNHF
jgi:KDO2-lipid IV(A) lauroyltransferase